MSRFCAKERQSRKPAIAAWVLVAIAFGAPSELLGQDHRAEDLATLQGSVRSSQGYPMAGAKVSLQPEGGTRTLTAQTDSEGSYGFAVSPGGYTLRANMPGYNEARFTQIVLGPNEVKKVDLTLAQASPQSSQAGSPQSETPEFFDEPRFTVAGVTDPTNLGGHGSDTVVRNKEELAKATVSLSRTPAEDANNASTLSRAEKPLRDAAGREPDNFDTNHRLGKLLIADGKAREAIPYLERASRLNPADFDNAYDLAVACAESGEYEHADTNIRTLLARQNRDPRDQAKLHHLLGDVEEKRGNPLEAVREYQHAAELDASEPNFFDWGSEMLIHRAAEPAIEVFAKGHHLFPGSVRMLVGLGAAWYSQGSSERAVDRLCEASDLNPDDPTPYLFLGRIQRVETPQSELLVEKLRRFVRLQPENAMANYYYAVSLWRHRQGSEDADSGHEVKALLQKAVRLDPKLVAGYLQLGILYSEQKDFSKAVEAYRQAIEVSPRLEEAHYRLAQAYRQIGEASKARAELQLYGQLSKEAAQQVERERHEIQQFVYTLRDQPSASQSQ